MTGPVVLALPTVLALPQGLATPDQPIGEIWSVGLDMHRTLNG